VATIDGTQPRRVTVDEADLTGIDWSGDGRSIVYSSDRAGGYSLWRVPIDGSTPTLIAGGAARMKHPVADRAGRRVVYENWNYAINVWQTAIDGRGEQPGRGTLGEDDGVAITRTSELWNLYPQVSPDGQRLAYVSTQSGSHELWVADRNGSHARQLTHSGRGVVKTPRWSPDSHRIVYLARGQGPVDVHIVDVDTGVSTRLTSTADNEVAPAWSHDGARILFGVPDATGAWNVWSLSATAPADRRLEMANAVAAQPADDGSALYFTRPDQHGLWRSTSAQSQSAARVLDDVSPGNTLGWLVSRAGIYFVDERDDVVHLRLAPHTGGEPQNVATLTQFTWPGFSVTPDGRAVLYAHWDRRESNLMSIEY
jgi:Tol biopolymer transport system component